MATAKLCGSQLCYFLALALQLSEPLNYVSEVLMLQPPRSAAIFYGKTALVLGCFDLTTTTKNSTPTIWFEKPITTIGHGL
jgi:hypothetical protein